MRRSSRYLAALVAILVVAPCLVSDRASAVVVEAQRVVDTDTAVPGGPFEDGTPGTFTNVFSGPAEGDQLVFYGRVVQDNRNRGQGLYSIGFGGGDPETIVDTRDCLGDPCTPFSNTVVNFLNYSFDGTTAAFEATWMGFRDSVWSATPSMVELLIEEGNPVPGGGGVDRLLDAAVDQAEVAFVADLPAAFEYGIYAIPTNGGSPRLVADSSTPVPGGGQGAFFDLFETDLEYRDGVIVFDSVSGFGGSAGVYVEDQGVLRVVADSQTQVPGRPGRTFSSFTGVLTDGGDVVFAGQTAFLGDRGIFAERGGTLVPTPIWLSATPDPCDATRRLDGFGTFALGDGDVVFVSEDGLYSARIGQGGLSRLLVVGDSVDGKTISDLSDALHHEAVEDGAVFPRLSFDDGSFGVYCLGIPSSPQCGPAPVPVQCVPEPGALLQLLAALAGCASLWWRRARFRCSATPPARAVPRFVSTH